MTHTFYHGDCLEVMPTLAANSVDTIITDPPYGLSFMGKDWDHGVPGVQFWREALRVAKPGAMLLAFGGPRTFHRLTCAIEDAGWEVRDVVSWLYGSGFPKSHDISKAIDKTNGEIGRLLKFTAWMRTTGLTATQINTATQTFMGSHYLTDKSQPAIPTPELWEKLRPLCGNVPVWVDELIERIEAEREVIGQDTKARSVTGKSALPTMGSETVYETWNITAPATDAAQQWHGWGTALKPAWEPVIMAMKPLDGTFAENALTWGVAGLNVDGARIGVGGRVQLAAGKPGFGAGRDDGYVLGTGARFGTFGRWPANLLLDEDAAAMLDEMSGERGGGYGVRGQRTQGEGWASRQNGTGGLRDKNAWRGTGEAVGYGDSGGASRFFYVAKAARSERDAGLNGMEALQIDDSREPDAPGANNPRNRGGRKATNFHPTVKPVELMRYLCRLTATPTGGVVLDPFMGSGTTGVACAMEGRHFIGVELDAGYFDIARKRIESVQPALMEAAD